MFEGSSHYDYFFSGLWIVCGEGAICDEVVDVCHRGDVENSRPSKFAVVAEKDACCGVLQKSDAQVRFFFRGIHDHAAVIDAMSREEHNVNVEIGGGLQSKSAAHGERTANYLTAEAIGADAQIFQISGCYQTVGNNSKILSALEIFSNRTGGGGSVDKNNSVVGNEIQSGACQ